MPQLGTADVTYTAVTGGARASAADPEKQHFFTVLFPNSSNVLYTSGGIPLSIAKLGCPANLSKFLIVDMASTTGYVAKFDYGATTIRLYQVAAVVTGSATAAQPLVEVLTSATVASTTLRCIAQGW